MRFTGTEEILGGTSNKDIKVGGLFKEGIEADTCIRRPQVVNLINLPTVANYGINCCFRGLEPANLEVPSLHSPRRPW